MFADDVCKISIYIIYSSAKNVNSVIKRLVD